MPKESGRRTAFWILLVVAGLELSGQLPAQSANDFQPTFNQATLKLAHPTPPYGVVLGNVSHGTVTFTNVTLAQCLKYALNFGGDGQITGPEWIKSPSALFDIAAETLPGMPDGRIRLMTLTLLTQRFSLKLRHEQRELPYYALVVDKKGSKLRPAASDAVALIRNGQIISQRASIPSLVFQLQYYANTPIVDETKLNGLFNIRLQWPVGSGASSTPPSVLSDALTEQLGLRLEPRKGPMDSVVVEHAERTPVLN